MDETNDTGNSSESSQQNSGASTTREQPRTARRPRLEINMIQYPRADTNKRELFPCDNWRLIKRRETRSHGHNAVDSGFVDSMPGTSRSYSQPGSSRAYSDAEYHTLLELGRISMQTAIASNSDDGDGLDDLITLQNSTCYMCNGFYAQNHGEVVCPVCHAFLFPHFAPDLPLKAFDEDSDSDSGNDEPQDAQTPLNMYTRTFLRDYRRLGFNIDVIPNVAPLNLYQEPENIVSDPSHAGLETLPTEVLLIIIRYLDETSIWSLSQANRRFSVVISQLISAEKWKHYTLQKWQFLNRNIGARNWYFFYTKMMKSSFCFRCVQAMSDHEIVVNEENPWRENRLRTESRSLQLDPLEGIWATPLDHLRYHWQACIEGPAGSPYEGGKFYLYMQVPYTYPMSPPVVRFITKIFHPNVSRHGDIGIDSIQHNWTLALTVGKVLISIQSLLTDPYCEVCMEPEIGKLYLHNRPAFEEQASIWTWKYAMNELKY